MTTTEEARTPVLVALPLDDPSRTLNDSALPSVMVWAGGEAYDELTLPGTADRTLDLDSCALAVGIYRAMTEAHAKEIATLSPALAAPRTDSDERAGAGTPWKAGQSYAREALLLETEEQALEVAVTTAGRIDLIIHNRAGDGSDDLTARMSREDAGRVVAALIEAGAPAPSSPGVPDSVRALSEAASPDWFTNDATPFILGPPIDGEIDRFEVIARGPHGYAKSGDDIRKWQANRMFAVAAVNYVRTLIAAHPAGQSEDDAERCGICDKPLIAGQRVMQDVELGTVHADCCGPEREAYVKDVESGEPLGPNDPIPQGYIYQPDHPAGQSTGQGAEPEPCAWAGGNDTCYCRTCGEEYRYGREDKPACPKKPAPDSTRTGQVGTTPGWVLVPETMDPIMIGAFWRWKNTGSDTPGEFGDDRSDAAAYRAMIAARPAAPEAQGAERVRHVKRGTEYEVLHRGVPLQIAVGTGYSPTGNCLHEDDRLVIYQGGGRVYAREEREFDDGRFEPAPPSSGQEG